MSPTEHLRSLMTPDASRWRPMLVGLAVFAAGIATAAALQPPAVIEAVLIVVALAAWFAGACAMVGYVRWFFASELTRAMRDRAEAIEREKKKLP